MKNYAMIYEHMGDSISKEIFGYRVLYTETGDQKWIEKIILMLSEGTAFLKKLTDDMNSKKLIFGAGAWGRELAEILPIGWNGFVDNYKKGTECCGLPVISFDEYLENYRDAYIVLTARLHYPEMVEQLREAGISEEKIINMGKIIDDMSHRQYFDLRELPHDENEVFVDCGCLDGATSLEFIKWSKGEYEHIYAFEPDPAQTAKCEAALGNDKADVYCLGCWKEKSELRFTAFLEGSSYVSQEGETVVNVNSLDNIMEGKKVTFIKMDIEGSEVPALLGAKKLIQENHPKLAISIYHRPEDIYEIPNLLLEYNPGYIFFVRHYSVCASETVLYAIDKNDLV